MITGGFKPNDNKFKVGIVIASCLSQSIILGLLALANIFILLITFLIFLNIFELLTGISSTLFVSSLLIDDAGECDLLVSLSSTERLISFIKSLSILNSSKLSNISFFELLVVSSKFISCVI